jgi:predicted esterase
MTSKNWSKRSALACAISLLGSGVFCPEAAAQTAPVKPPAIALLGGADAAANAAEWQNWTRDLGWKVLTPAGSANPNIDVRVQELVKAVEAAVQGGEADPARIYLAGRGDSAAAVFYAISRVPDLWAAGIALGGSPKAAVDTNRIFTANFTNVPVLWVSDAAGEALAQKLKAAGLNLEWQSAATAATASPLIQWLGRHQRDDFPLAIDCETNSPTFARCYWVRMTKFDAAERNDVLPSTRIAGGNSAALDLGGFGFKLDDPGPGVLVSQLPEKYSGPLKMGDRIVSLDGREIANARQYRDQMEKVTEEKLAVAAVQRGKDRIRMETRIIVPRRDPAVSARVQARYLPDDKEIQIVSRTVTEMRINVPPQWAPAKLVWNGLSLENMKEPGCWVLTVQKELLNAARCP